MGGIAAAFAVLAAAVLSWGTLCRGDDGHVAFEIVVDGRCLDGGKTELTAEHPVHLNDCKQEAGCGPCTDLRGTADAWLASAGQIDPCRGGPGGPQDLYQCVVGQPRVASRRAHVGVAPIGLEVALLHAAADCIGCERH